MANFSLLLFGWCDLGPFLVGSLIESVENVGAGDDV